MNKQPASRRGRTVRHSGELADSDNHNHTRPACRCQLLEQADCGDPIHSESTNLLTVFQSDCLRRRMYTVAH